MNLETFLDPKLINSVEDLALISKIIAENFLLGLNQSVKVGYGQEFSQYRSYEPGDDLRFLDWKLYARNDRYYVRQSEIETNVNVRFIIDSTSSMNHTYNNLTKLDFVKLLVATVGYLAVKQNDSISFHAINDKHTSGNNSQASHSFHHFLYGLTQIQADSLWPSSENTILKEIHASKTKDMIIFISDMYQKEDEHFHLLEKLTTLKNECILFHVLAENELDLSLEKQIPVEDLETGEILSFNLSDQKEYKENLDQYSKSLERYMLSTEGSYHQISFHSLDKALRNFLKQRAHFV